MKVYAVERRVQDSRNRVAWRENEPPVAAGALSETWMEMRLH